MVGRVEQTRSSDVSASGAEGPGKSRVLVVFVGLMVAMLLASLDQTVFSTALPTIVGELDGVDHMLWVTTAYMLASTVMMPLYGKLGDLIGRKWLFVGALALFVVGSLIGGLVEDMTGLIVARAVQGLGGGGLMILSQAIIADIVPVRQRPRYMGVMGSIFGLSSIIGPLLGGWFTEGIGWRWAFWINVPLGLVAIVLAVVFLMPPVRRSALRFDLWGTVTMAVAVTAIILVASWGGTQYDWDSGIILGLMAVAVVFAALFLIAESRASEPIIPLALFRNRNFVLATTAGLFIGVAMFGAISYLPTYLQIVVGVNATVSGLVLLPMMLGLMVTALITGQLAAKTGRYKWMPIMSMVVLAIALSLLSTLTVDTSVWALMGYLFALGAGIGLSMQILILIVQNSLPDREVGTATAANNFFREIGASLGSAVVGAVFTARLTELLTDRIPTGAGGATGDTNSLTPALVDGLPDALHDIIAGAYNDALTPVFLLLVPMVAAGFVLVLFVKEAPLRAEIDLDHETPESSVAGTGVHVASATATSSSALASADHVPDR